MLERERVERALPGYDLGDEIGRGGFGVVLAAQHRQLGRKVAVKELPPAFAADVALRRRFATEAKLLATLDHPHIVPIFDYVEEDGLCLLVMEFLPGGTAWSRFTTAGFSAETACSLTLATCSALHYAHGRGILHRDIKPDNVLFTEAGTIKVSDFGIAKVVGGTASLATRTGEVLGTPAYMAPEQAMGTELSPATDVYALGTVLYELLSGRLPYSDDGNAIGLLYRHVHEDAVPLRAVADISPPLADVVMRALARDIADRYATAEDFGVAVADAARGALGSGWVQRGGLTVMASGRIGERISAGADAATALSTVQMPATTPTVRAAATKIESPIVAEEPVPEELVPVQAFVEPSESEPPESEPALPPDVPRRRNRALLAVAAIVAVLAIGAIGAAVLAGGGDDAVTTQPGGQPDGSSLPAATTFGVAATIDVGKGADHATTLADFVYVTVRGNNTVARIDPATNDVTTIATLDEAPHSITAIDDALWVTANDSGTSYVIDPATPGGAGVETVPLAVRFAEVVSGAGSVWGSSHESGLIRVDPDTRAVLSSIPTDGEADSVGFGEGGVWVANRDEHGTVVRVDPATNLEVARIPVGASPDGLAVGAGAVWTANTPDGTVSRIDPATNEVVATIRVGPKPVTVTVGAGAVWVSNSGDGTVSRIDPATNAVTATTKVGRNPESSTIAAENVFVVNHGDGTVSRLAPRR